jgi:biotin carboxylase
MISRKKLLLLGGTDNQVPVIKTAQSMGCYVITCDYLPSNPGHQISDEYHNVSTTDKEGVLELAKRLNVDGIFAYASDPAAPTAAYVCEKLGLPTNPYHAVELLTRKDLFRKFMVENGFMVPRAESFTSYQSAYSFHESLNKRALVKPVDSSGSKGVFIIEPQEDFKAKFDIAMTFTRVGRVIVEEFIYKSGRQVGGDGFLVDGRLVFRCFGDSYFSKTNPLLPCALSFPTLRNADQVEKIHRYLENILRAAGMKMGGLNFDLVLDENENIHVIEIGARNGGNMLPDIIEKCTGVDLKVYSIKAALGEDCSDLILGHEEKYFSNYVIHANSSGILKGIHKSSELEKLVIMEQKNYIIGGRVEKFIHSGYRLSTMIMKYSSKEEMQETLANMDQHITVDIEGYSSND